VEPDGREYVIINGSFAATTDIAVGGGTPAKAKKK